MNALAPIVISAVLCGTAATPGLLAVGEMPAVTVCAGDSVVVVISFEVAEGFHIQANPAANEFLIPLSLTFAPGDSLVSIVPEYPDADLFRLEGTTDDLPTYHGARSLKACVRVRADAPAGERRLVGELHYQACDSKRCYFPASVPITMTVVVAETAACAVR